MGRGGIWGPGSRGGGPEDLLSALPYPPPPGRAGSRAAASLGERSRPLQRLRRARPRSPPFYSGDPISLSHHPHPPTPPLGQPRAEPGRALPGPSPAQASSGAAPGPRGPEAEAESGLGGERGGKRWRPP